MAAFSLRRLLTLVGWLALCGALNDKAMAIPVVHLTASLTSPQPLGTTVTLTVSATDTDPGTISYRFEIGSASKAVLEMVRDYSVATIFNFTPTVHEEFYQFKVTARNNSTLATASQTITPFRFSTLVSGGSPVVTPTANQLVALFSAPACASGSVMRVSFLRGGDTHPTYTSWKACNPLLSMNFLVAGMRAGTLYHMHSETWNGTTLTGGPILAFTTGTPPVTFPAITLPTPPTPQDSLAERFVLLATLAPAFPLAVDLNGNPVWYYTDPSGITPTITRPVAGGTILMLATGTNSTGSGLTSQQILREIDLAGNTLHETNATRVSEQVVALSGLPSSCQIGSTECIVGSFHHEAIRLPNGHTLVMTDDEKLFTDGTQGSSPSNPVEIIGDLIVDLDPNWQVAWYWRAFDHLNVNRAAVLGETCKAPGGGGCPPVTLASVANDWLHGNAIYYIPSDGNVLMSLRHQDHVVKIDYHNGAGTGNVLWTLGLGGDFAMNSTDLYPWFSHQHDVGFEQNGTTVLSLFDNGNTRIAQNPGEHSRGYVLNVDETNMVVTPALLADLGVYSLALGSAQQLTNGDYHFLAGDLMNPGSFNQSIEVSPNGAIGYNLQVTGDLAYRSFRMANLYTPPVK